MAFRSMDSSTPSSPRVEGRPISLIKSASASTPAQANFLRFLSWGKSPYVDSKFLEFGEAVLIDVPVVNRM